MTLAEIKKRILNFQPTSEDVRYHPEVWNSITGEFTVINYEIRIAINNVFENVKSKKKLFENLENERKENLKLYSDFLNKEPEEKVNIFKIARSNFLKIIDSLEAIKSDN